MKLKYTQNGDYLIPNLKMNAITNKQIGKYGILKLNHIKNFNKPLYTELLLSGTLNSYLNTIDIECSKLYEILITSLKISTNITEDLKNSNQMEWVGKMNNLKDIANEIILNNIIYETNRKGNL